MGTSAAEELTAETFAIAHRRWGDLDPTRPARPWPYGIASNLLKHHWRSERRMLRAYARTGLDREVAEDSVTPERLDAQAARPALAEALAGLRRQERDVLLLWAWAELSDVEIADSLGLPLGTVKSRLSRARQQMRNRLYSDRASRGRDDGTDRGAKMTDHDLQLLREFRSISP